MSIYTKFLIIVAVAALSSPSPLNEKKIPHVQSKSVKICAAKGCRQLAQIYTDAMDKNADPCKNFYEFTCGGWIAKNPIPKYLGMWNRFHLIESSIEKRRKDMLTTAAEATDMLPIQQAKKFYQSCMDNDSRKARGIKTIASLLESNGGWPMAMNIQDWKSDEHPWQQVDGNFVALGADYTFYKINPTLKTNGDVKDPRIDLQSPSDNDFPEFRRKSQQYQSMLQPIVKAFIRENRAKVSAEQLEKDIRDLFFFQRKLQDARRLSMTNQGSKISLDKLNFNFSFLRFGWPDAAKLMVTAPKARIDWKKAIQRLFDLEDMKIDGNLEVNLETMYYYALPEILALTKPRTIVNYVHWKFVSQTLKYTTAKMRNQLSVAVGRDQNLPRWRRCLRETQMAHVDAYWFAENYFGENIQETASKVVENVREELNHQMETSNWLSNNAKAAVQEKLRKMDILMGFPDWNKNRTAIEHHYKGLKIADDYVMNILSFQKYQKTLAIRTYAGREQDKGWLMSALDVGATYVMDRNIVNIPASWFQRPFFSSKLPDYVHYAIIGMVIGHEMGHAFDPTTIGISANGTDSMLDLRMMNNYRKQYSCIKKKSMDYFKEKWMGSQTLNENIADIMGIQSSWGAYQRLRQNKKLRGDLKLPGFEEYTDEQMFFISYGRGWCELIAPEYERSSSSVHSPPEFRVNSGVSNTPDFGKAFNCPLPSSMNPVAKCSIWTKPVSSAKEKLDYYFYMKND